MADRNLPKIIKIIFMLIVIWVIGFAIYAAGPILINFLQKNPPQF